MADFLAECTIPELENSGGGKDTRLQGRTTPRGKAKIVLTSRNGYYMLMDLQLLKEVGLGSSWPVQNESLPNMLSGSTSLYQIMRLNMRHL